MEDHKYLKDNGTAFDISAEDLISADTRDVLIAECKRVRNVGRGWR